MIDKQLNRIREKVNVRALAEDELVVTKKEGQYLLRLIKIAEEQLNANS